ncbi:hypothetical protein BKA66DRAFT_554652 [Pyrenochaeta sp. MPI-SDFR-AT-0127]|nr:hypothetical protein BKA66DRAFT_554652 [Pyrenochaeta sp. MPI-SDFR-AT-0127]
MESSCPTVDAEVCCPDPTRSSTGAWLLSGTLEHRVDELKSQDPSRTIAKCFELLGAEWVDDYYGEPNDPPKNFYFTDPVKTTCIQVTDGREYRGGWCMTQEQKAEVDALKTANPDWEWSRCFEEAGGRWDARYYYHVQETHEDVQSTTQGA